MDKNTYFEHGPDDNFAARRSCEGSVVSVEVPDICRKNFAQRK